MFDIIFIGGDAGAWRKTCYSLTALLTALDARDIGFSDDDHAAAQRWAETATLGDRIYDHSGRYMVFRVSDKEEMV